MDEPVPIRRAAIGCLLLAVAGLALALMVRPVIFSLAPPRDDSAVIVSSATEVTAGPIRRDLVLSRSYGWSGERDAGAARVQLAVIVAPSRFGAVTAVNATSPANTECLVQIGADRLTDCDGRAWSFEGFPLDTADPPLERIGVEVVSGSVVLDLTHQVEE